MAANSYPSGLYPSQRPPGYAPYNQPNDENQLGQVVGDDPSFESDAYLQMSVNWFPIDVCVGGTSFFRYNAETLLAQEPAELEDAWQRRVSRATFSPFTVRIAEQALVWCLGSQLLESKSKMEKSILTGMNF